MTRPCVYEDEQGGETWAKIPNPLDIFERLVLSQTPASTPWVPVTDYSFETRKAIEGPHAQLVKDVFDPHAYGLNTGAVVDAGCGPGHFVRLLREVGMDATGFDINPPPWLQRADLTDVRSWADFRYDLVICREVLEHLTVTQIRRAVTKLCALAIRYVYVTTRFATRPTSLLDFETDDDLDPTHITLLNQDFLRVLFVLEGFKRRADLESRMDWKHFGRVLVYERA